MKLLSIMASNLLLQIKISNCVFKFAGCLNGGGQLSSSDGEDSKDLLSRVREIYNNVETRTPVDSPLVHKLYTEWLGDPESEKAKSLLHTRYHEVEKLTNALTIKW